MFSPRSLGQLLLAGQIRKTGSYDLHSDSNNNTNWPPDANSKKNSSSTSLDIHDEVQRRYDFTKRATKLIAVLKRRSNSYQLASARSHFTSANLQLPPSSSPSTISIESLNNRHTKDGVTLCTLGVGTTFGASVAPGKTHSVSVVTSDECTLLRVRRADFQEIFNEQSHLIGDLESSPFCSSTSLLASRHSCTIGQHAPGLSSGTQEDRNHQHPSQGASVSTSSAATTFRRPNLTVNSSGADGLARRCVTPNNESVGCEPEDQEEPVELGELARLSLSSAPGDKRRASGEQLELPSQLMRIGWLLRTLIVHQAPLMIQNRRLVRQPVARPSQVAALASTATTGPVNRKQLVSTGSSSQLLAGRSAASQAGRRVAGYVVSSLMRSRNQHQQSAQSSLQQPPIQSHQVVSSNSFDLNAPGQTEPTGGVQLVRRSMLGRDMVDWLLSLGAQPNSAGSAGRYVNSRLQAVSMWQVLLEQGVVVSALQASSVCGPQSCRAQFCDDSLSCYQFWCDQSDQPDAGVHLQRPNELELAKANESLWWALKVLAKLAPDACFRLILSKQPHERSFEEVDIVFEELQHLKALSHLGNGVKKQLAACVTSEHHPKQNTVIFNQGDTGQSWYIILRGSVNVVIVGKGVVCTLQDGDDFGKLALVNDAPRAATIVTNEPNCYFLRVDKLDFNTILRDVEANTVRLKEHGKEVLILQRVPIGREQPAISQAGQTAQVQSGAPDGGAAGGCPAAMEAHQSNPSAGSEVGGSQAVAAASVQATQHQQASSGLGAPSSALKYMVMAGTGEKMLEHLLETRIDGQTQIGPLITCKSGLMQHDQVSAYIQSGNGDNFLEDFILTHKIFMPTGNLCQELFKHYQCQPKQLQSQITLKEHQSQQQHSQLDDDYLVAKKRRVVKFVRCWMLISREQFFHQHQIQSFLTDLHQKVKQDTLRFPALQPELKAISRILELHLEEELGSRHRGIQRWICDIYGNMLPLRRLSAGAWQPGDTESSETYLRTLHQRRLELKPSTIEAQDEVIFRVYCTDHTFATVRARLDDEAAQIKQVAAKCLQLLDKELILVHVKSNGERIIFNDLDANLVTSLSVNGRIFVCPLDHIDAISPLPEQDPFQEVYRTLAISSTSSSTLPTDTSLLTTSANSSVSSTSSSQAGASGWQASSSGPSGSSQPSACSEPINSHQLVSTPSSYADIKTQMNLSCSKLDEFSSRDIAYCLTQLAWSLLKNMHEFELIYILFGRQNFQNHKQITANLNVFLRHFNEIQYWVVTQICLSNSLSKRVQILRKFVKIAAYCKELQNLNAFFAIIMGLSNMAVARLTQTWEKLPSKLKRTFSQFESLIDPSRNHRRYRIFMSKMEPPIIPFMPLLLKDMTFAHEGNKTYLESGLINFEKMQMVAQTLRTIRYCKSRPLKLDLSACKYKGSIRSIELFFRDLKIIDNQRTLTQMSHHLELRKT